MRNIERLPGDTGQRNTVVALQALLKLAKEGRLRSCLVCCLDTGLRHGVYVTGDLEHDLESALAEAEHAVDVLEEVINPYSDSASKMARRLIRRLQRGTT